MIFYLSLNQLRRFGENWANSSSLKQFISDKLSKEAFENWSFPLERKGNYFIKKLGKMISNLLNDLEWPKHSREWYFQSRQMYLTIFLLSYHWKIVAWPITLKKWRILKFLDLSSLCGKFAWNGPSGTGKEDENVKIYWRWCQRWRQPT